MIKNIEEHQNIELGDSLDVSKEIINRSRIKAFIMAGGRGLRLEPLSSLELPKQFIKLLDRKSLFQITVERNSILGRSCVITQHRYLDIVLDQLKEIRAEADLIIEPSARNTRACAVIAAYYAIQNGYDGMILIPSDHIVEDLRSYNITLMRAANLLYNNIAVQYSLSHDTFQSQESNANVSSVSTDSACDDLIHANSVSNALKCNAVSIGIKSDRPEPDFGYIETNVIGMMSGSMIGGDILLQTNNYLDMDFLDHIDYRTLYNITRFEEKPKPYEVADSSSILKQSNSELVVKPAKDCFWNSGIYCLKPNYVIGASMKASPDETLLLESAIKFASHRDGALFLAQEYFDFVSEASFETAFAENMKDMLMIEGCFGWQDLGSLRRLVEYLIDNRVLSEGVSIAETHYVPMIITVRKSVIIVFKGKFIFANRDDFSRILIYDI